MWRFQYLNAVSLFLSAYPWRSEHEKGREEGIKDRPCVIILAVENDEGHLMVTVAPVTHSAPLMPDTAVEIPLATKRRLGLDDARSWVMVNEGNRFAWPGPDIRLVSAECFDYGLLPPALFAQIQKQFADYVAAKRALIVPRTE